jgi:hypothetical protein
MDTPERNETSHRKGAKDRKGNFVATVRRHCFSQPGNNLDEKSPVLPFFAQLRAFAPLR